MTAARLERLNQVIDNVSYLELKGSRSLVDDLEKMSRSIVDEWPTQIRQILDSIDMYINGEERRTEFLRWVVRGHLRSIMADPLLDDEISDEVRRVAQEVHISSRT